MNWSDIGPVAELIGAVGVVASLAYVARQVRQNTRALRMANAAAAQNNFQHLARFLYEDRPGCALILRAMQDPRELTPAERLSAYAYFFDFMKTAEVAHHNYVNGDLDEAFWEASLRFYRAYFSTPGFRTYWEERRTAFMPAFQEAMDTWLAAAPPAMRPDELVTAKPPRTEQETTV